MMFYPAKLLNLHNSVTNMLSAWLFWQFDIIFLLRRFSMTFAPYYWKYAIPFVMSHPVWQQRFVLGDGLVSWGGGAHRWLDETREGERYSRGRIIFFHVALLCSCLKEQRKIFPTSLFFYFTIWWDVHISRLFSFHF